MTEKLSRAEIRTKSQRALELREKGLSPAQIAERLGTTGRSVNCMISAERERRRHAAAMASLISKVDA